MNIVLLTITTSSINVYVLSHIQFDAIRKYFISDNDHHRHYHFHPEIILLYRETFIYCAYIQYIFLLFCTNNIPAPDVVYYS